MDRPEGLYWRPDSGFWWINATLPNGQRICRSAGTENREEAETLLAKLKFDAYEAITLVSSSSAVGKKP